MLRKSRIALFAAIVVPMTGLTGGLAWAADAPDTTAPVVSSTGVAHPGWLAQFNKLVPAYSDDVAVTKLEVLLDGAVVATHEGKLPREVQVNPPVQLHEHEVALTVRAFDAAGNRGEATTRVQVDLLSPQATPTPRLGSIVSGVVTITAPDASAYPNRPGDLARVNLIDDSTGRVLAQATGAPWKLTWDTKGLNGDTDVAFLFMDRADNAAYLEGEYRVDNAGPSIGAITPAHRALVRGPFKTTVQAADVSGIASARVKGGKATASQFTWNVTPKGQGPQTVEWTVTDRRGHTTIARRTVVNDTVKPKLAVTKAPKSGAKVKGTVTVTASAADLNGINRVELLVNGKVVAKDAKAGYTFSVNTSRYGKRFTVRLQAHDKAGNVTSSPARTWLR